MAPRPAKRSRQSDTQESEDPIIRDLEEYLEKLRTSRLVKLEMEYPGIVKRLLHDYSNLNAKIILEKVYEIMVKTRKNMKAEVCIYLFVH